MSRISRGVADRPGSRRDRAGRCGYRPLARIRISRALPLILALWLAAPASAQYVAALLFDAKDMLPGNGVCDIAGVTHPSPPNPSPTSSTCTLRAAIQETNAGSGGSIELLAGTYGLSIAGATEFDNLTGDLNVRADLLLSGAGVDVTIVDGGAIDRVFMIDNGVQVLFENLTITNGRAPSPQSWGGGLWNGGNLTLRDVAVRNNLAAGAGGGGIINGSSLGGTLTLIRTAVTGNQATGRGGGIDNSGDLTLMDSTVSGNVQQNFGGGGIANEAGGTAVVINSTLSGNEACCGGGLINFGVLKLRNVTISANTTTSGGDSIWNSSGAVLETKHSIASNRASPSPLSNCTTSSPLTSLGHNLSNDAACSFNQATDLVNADAKLASLADNGGPTQTHLLLVGSEAIDAGDPAGCTDTDGFLLTTDQRGSARPFDGDGDGTSACDIGAVELVPEPAKTLLQLIALACVAALRRCSAGSARFQSLVSGREKRTRPKRPRFPWADRWSFGG